MKPFTMPLTYSRFYYDDAAYGLFNLIFVSSADPLRVTVQPESQRVDVGMPARLVCVVEGYPVNKVSWLRNGRAVSDFRSSDAAADDSVQISGDGKVSIKVLNRWP